MLNLTKAEVTLLGQLVAQRQQATGESLTDAGTPLGQLFQKLYDELYAMNEAEQQAAAAAQAEVERQAAAAAAVAAYPVKAGDAAEIKIGKRTYRCKVMTATPGYAAHHNTDVLYLHLQILRKDGQPSVAMNGGKHGQGWFGWVAASDIRKVEA